MTGKGRLQHEGMGRPTTVTLQKDLLQDMLLTLLVELCFVMLPVIICHCCYMPSYPIRCDDVISFLICNSLQQKISCL